MSDPDHNPKRGSPEAVEIRVSELEQRLGKAEKRIKDLNYVVYKLLSELGGKELLARRETEERH